MADASVTSASASPVVSVVLPVRNGAETIARAVASIQTQTFNDWELLVVDDGSSDETRAIVAGIAQHDPRVRLLPAASTESVSNLTHACHSETRDQRERRVVRRLNPSGVGAALRRDEPVGETFLSRRKAAPAPCDVPSDRVHQQRSEESNGTIAGGAVGLEAALSARGIVAALNRGLAAARGEFIARMDADDHSQPGRLAAQVSFLRAPQNQAIGLVGCRVAFGGDRTTHAGYALHVDWINALLTSEQIALNRFVESPLAHPSVMFRRELVERHGGYRDGDFPEDYELWLRWLDVGVKMAKLPDELLCWNDSPTRLSRADARYDPEAFFRVKAEWIAREVKRIIGSRRLLVWGAGRPTRKRAAWLEAHGVAIGGYVDVDAKKATPAIGGTGAPVIQPADLPPPSDALVLGYVSSRGARQLIRAELLARGYREGTDFLLCA